MVLIAVKSVPVDMTWKGLRADTRTYRVAEIDEQRMPTRFFASFWRELVEMSWFRIGEDEVRIHACRHTNNSGHRRVLVAITVQRDGRITQEKLDLSVAKFEKMMLGHMMLRAIPWVLKGAIRVSEPDEVSVGLLPADVAMIESGHNQQIRPWF